jgi:hypothetical protein
MKNNNIKLKNLLFEKRTLNEDDGGGGDYGGYGDLGFGDYGGGGGGGGGGYSSHGSQGMYNTFVQPFTDIVKTAAGGFEAISTHLWGIAKNMIKAIPALIVPFMHNDYKKLKNETMQRLESVDKEYADVYKRNVDFLTGGSDIRTIAFILYPSLLLGEELLTKSPGVVIDMLSGILGDVAGGFSNIVLRAINAAHTGASDYARSLTGDPNVGKSRRDEEQIQQVLGALKGIRYDVRHRMQERNQRGLMMTPLLFNKAMAIGYLSEANVSKEQQAALVTALKMPEVHNAIDKVLKTSPKVKRVQQTVLNSIVQHITEFMEVQNLEDLKKMMGPEQAAQFISQLKAYIPQQAAQPQQPAVVTEQEMVPGTTNPAPNDQQQVAAQKNIADLNAKTMDSIKQAYKQFYIDLLTKTAQQYPDIAPIINKTIETIKTIPLRIV